MKALRIIATCCFALLISNLLVTETHAQGWVIDTVDSVGTVGTYAHVTTDSSNKVHICYFDETASPALKYATNASGQWHIDTLDTKAWASCAIAFDANNKVHISYGRSDGIYYITNASGQWVSQLVDNAGGGGWTSTPIAVDLNNKVHISYFDKANYVLKYATNASGQWNTQTLDGQRGSGQYSSLAVDSKGNVHISYGYSGDSVSHWALKYVTNTSGQWVSSIIDINGWWANHAMAIDSSDKVHISYQKNGGLSYATNASGQWTNISIDPNYYATLESMAVDPAGKLHIAYDVTNSGSNALWYATNSSGTWTSERIGDMGSAPNWHGEFSISIATDSIGNVHVAYYDINNKDLRYAFKDGQNAAYLQGYNAGRQACIDNPSSCGISTSVSGLCATYNPSTAVVHLPCLNVGGMNYWVDLGIYSLVPTLTFDLKNFGAAQ